MKAEAEKLLIDGRQLLNDGRTHEAGMVADSVLEIDPSNASALALRGDIFERDGQFQEALETYRRVMELRPDNAMDRIRVAHLEKLVAAEEIAVEEPGNSKRGVLLVAAAGVLLASVGAALYLVSLNTPTDTEGWVAKNSERASGFSDLNATLVPNAPTEANIRSSGNGTTPEGQATPGPGRGRIEQVYTDPTPGFQRGGTDNGQTPPFQPPVNLRDWENPGTVAQNNPGPVNNGGGNTTARPVDEEPTTVPEKQEDPGVIEIRTTPGGNESSNPASANSGAMSAEALIQKARNLYIQEDYSGAAQAYEQAIKAGAATGATYQRLAQCYEKMGRRADAIRNYRNAISSFDRQISRGNGSDSVRAAKESCERAIAALGG